MYKLLGLLAILLFYCSCQEKKGKQEQMTVASETEELYCIDPTQIPAGARLLPKRNVDSLNLPLVLDYTSPDKKTEMLDLSRYFDSVRTVVIEHPFPAEKGGFLYDCPTYCKFDRGMSSFHLSSEVLLSHSFLIAGDDFFGRYIYDLTGRLQDTLTKPNFKFDFKRSPLSLSYQLSDVCGEIGPVNVWGNCCSFLRIDTAHRFTTVWYNLDKGKETRYYLWKQGKGPRPQALDKDHYFELYPTLFAESKVFLRTFGPKGDTLCEFTDYIRPEKPIQGNYTYPDRNFMYRLKGRTFLRQAFSDTIFQFEGADRLVPVYLLNFGDKRLDITTGTTGDKKGKFIPSQWIESPQLILFSYTENYDCPNTRDNKEVKYHYSFYDKTRKQIFYIPVEEDVYPEQLLVANSLKGGLPFTWDLLTGADGKYMMAYPKSVLENITRMPAFRSLPAAQQQEVQKTLAALNDRQMVVMILE